MQLWVGEGQVCIRSPCGGRGGEALGSSTGFITSIKAIDCDFLCVYTYAYMRMCVYTQEERNSVPYQTLHMLLYSMVEIMVEIIVKLCGYVPCMQMLYCWEHCVRVRGVLPLCSCVPCSPLHTHTHTVSTAGGSPCWAQQQAAQDCGSLSGALHRRTEGVWCQGDGREEADEDSPCSAGAQGQERERGCKGTGGGDVSLAGAGSEGQLGREPQASSGMNNYATYVHTYIRMYVCIVLEYICSYVLRMYVDGMYCAP